MAAQNNRRKIYQVVAGLIALSMLSGCGKEAEKSVPIKMEEVPRQEQQVSWQDTHVPLAYPYEYAVVVGRVLYGAVIEADGVVVVSQSVESGEIINEAIIPGETAVKSITADSQGNIYAAGESSFWEINPEGEVRAFEDFVLEDLEKAINVTVKGIYTDGNGYFYLHYAMGLPVGDFYEDMEEDVFTWADRVYIKDSQLKTVFYEQIPDSRGNRLVAFSLDGDGRPMILAQDPEGLYVSEIDVAEKKTVSKTQLGETRPEEITQVSFTEAGFLFCEGNDLLLYDYEKKAAEKILNLLSYGILAGDIRYLGMDNGIIEVVDNYDIYAASEYVAIAEGESQKTTVTLGLMNAAEQLEDIVAAYNRFNGEIRVEIKQYDMGDDYERGLQQLKLDLVSGEAPDMIDVSLINADVYMAKGVFADLYDFMDADPSFDREMLLEPVRRAYESEGHLYSMGAAFQLHTIWGADSVVNGRQGVTMEEMIQVLESRGKNINAIFGFSADEPVLTTLCTFAMNEFIDWDQGKCDFSGQYMKEILDFAKEYTGVAMESYLEEIQKGEILLTIGCIRKVADYQLQREIYGEEVSFIGCPTVQGTGTAVGGVGEELAVNAKSDKQEQAWDFFKYFIRNTYNDSCFPTYRENFDVFISEAMADTIREYDGETYIEPKGTYAHGDAYIEVFAAGQQDVDTVLALIDGAAARYKYNTDIQNIINEEAESYFQGQKDYESVARVIQSRVSIYLAEQAQ